MYSSILKSLFKLSFSTIGGGSAKKQETILHFYFLFIKAKYIIDFSIILLSKQLREKIFFKEKLADPNSDLFLSEGTFSFLPE